VLFQIPGGFSSIPGKHINVYTLIVFAASRRMK
jgi:hypothetical protein